jgi:hypothetical protein
VPTVSKSRGLDRDLTPVVESAVQVAAEYQAHGRGQKTEEAHTSVLMYGNAGSSNIWWRSSEGRTRLEVARDSAMAEMLGWLLGENCHLAHAH